MPLMMKEDKAFDPMDVSLLGLVAVVTEPENVTNMIKQFRLPCRRKICARRKWGG
jgi:hypothetical protein